MEEQTPAELSVDDLGNLVLSGDEAAPEADADKAEVLETSEQAAAHSEEESFMPKESVTPGQEKAYKSMQGAFTRKMQELSTKLREAEAVREQAELFKQVAPVLQDPEFQKVLSAYKEGQGSQEAEDEPEIDPSVRAYLDKKLSSMDEARKFEMLKLRRETELRDLAAAHPDDWKATYPQIVGEIRKHPTMTVEEAYRKVKEPHLEQEVARLQKEIETLKSGKRKEMSVSPGTRVATPVQKQGPPKDMREAAMRALDKLNREGVDVRKIL